MAGLRVYAALIGLSLYVAKTCIRWAAASSSLGQPRWRGAGATLGFAAATSSLALILALAIHAFFTGGFPYYSRLLLIASRIGFLTAFVGILGGLAGKDPLEVPTIVTTGTCLLIWFLEAMAQ